MSETRINATIFLGFSLLIVGSIALLIANTLIGIVLLTGASASFAVSLYSMRSRRSRNTPQAKTTTVG